MEVVTNSFNHRSFFIEEQNGMICAANVARGFANDPVFAINHRIQNSLARIELVFATNSPPQNGKTNIGMDSTERFGARKRRSFPKSNRPRYWMGRERSHMWWKMFQFIRLCVIESKSFFYSHINVFYSPPAQRELWLRLSDARGLIQAYFVNKSTKIVMNDEVLASALWKWSETCDQQILLIGKTSFRDDPSTIRHNYQFVQRRN